SLPWAPPPLIKSEPLLQELQTISRAKFAVDPVELPLLAQLNEEAEIVTPAELRGGVCRDEDDDVVLATALAGKADVIVMGDEDLLVLKKFRGIEILSPRQFLKLL